MKTESIQRRATAACALAALALFACLGCSREPSAPQEQETAARSGTSEARATQCTERDPLRQVFFGDLHIHTSQSMDAYIFNTRNTPYDAYRFARGMVVPLLGPGDNPASAPKVRLARPLDFAAVTDHAAALGGVVLCTHPDYKEYGSELCRAYRKPFVPGSLESGVKQVVTRVASLTSKELCGEDGAKCRQAAQNGWHLNRDAAERWNDGPPNCSFTTFHAYEYTLTPELTKIHRNVIFRNHIVPEQPISSLDQPDGDGLFRTLEEQCNRAGTGCEALTIPHNSNLSNGNLFYVDRSQDVPLERQIEAAKRRANIEPLVEIMQMKGDSECRNGLWNVVGNDELCDFEKYRPKATPDCEDGRGKGALADRGCVSRRDYVRYALIEGLREKERLGVNPFKTGFIAATDVHDGMPGRVEEYDSGHDFSRKSLAQEVRKNPDVVAEVTGANAGSEAVAAPSTISGPGSGARPYISAPSVRYNPGGLAAVWAEENSREALFAALKRRETYATSGPRITARFFGGWDYSPQLCERHDMVAKGYAGGVPMGGDLSAPPGEDAAPTFVAWAMADPGVRGQQGNALQRVQIIKGWADDDGKFHQHIYEVAGNPKNGASVDQATCATRPAAQDGARSLCAVWSDPEFDRSQSAVYYARVVENPSCHATSWACAQAPDGQRPPYCDDPKRTRVTQERAWTSPIWYEPL